MQTPGCSSNQPLKKERRHQIPWCSSWKEKILTDGHIYKLSSSRDEHRRNTQFGYLEDIQTSGRHAAVEARRKQSGRNPA